MAQVFLFRLQRLGEGQGPAEQVRFTATQAGQEATVRTGHQTTDRFQVGKGVRQGCILSPCLFNLYAEYIRRNTGLDEAEAGIKTARRNINANETTLMAENEE